MSNDINYREYQMKKMQEQIKRMKAAMIMMLISVMCFAICAYGSMCVMRKYKAYSEELEQKVSTMQEELDSAKTNETAMEAAYMSLKYEAESQEEAPTEETPEEVMNESPEEESAEDTITTYISSDPYSSTNLTADQFNSIINSVCESYGRSTSGFIYSGYGQALADTESTYGVNGLVILGMAQAESGLNTSNNAWATNNATSICKNGKLIYYSSPYESIMATGNLLSKYHNKGCNTIYDIGSIYCPVNPDWANVVQSYIDRFVSYAG